MPLPEYLEVGGLESSGLDDGLDEEELEAEDEAAAFFFPNLRPPNIVVLLVPR